MRLLLFVAALGIGLLILGGTCQPFTNTLALTATPGQTMNITLSKPAADATVAQGTPVIIEWQAANLTGQPGTVTFRVESRIDLSQTSLPNTFAVGATGANHSFSWDTTNFVGPCAVIGQIQAAGQTQEITAVGRITIDAPPELQFTAPPGDVTFDPNTDGTLTIDWKAHDESATGRLGLDPDTQHNSGNEIFIHDFTVTEPNTPTSQESAPDSSIAKRRNFAADIQGGATETEFVADTFAWDGKDSSGQAVSPGTYNLFASVTDNVNPVLFVDGLGLITISSPVTDPNQTQNHTAQITDPNGDTTFLTTTPTLTIQYAVNQTADVLVDLKIDTDDARADGNERTILAQQFVAGGSAPNPFDWNGNDAAGAVVGPGIYRLFLSISTGSGTPTTADGTGFVFRRDDPNQPLIALFAPTAGTHVDPGQTVNLTWRDDDPTGTAMIHIVIANSANPDDHVNDPPILANRAAADDGVRDTFAWQVPTTGFTPNTQYFVIAYIENGDGVLKSSSVAAGWIVLNNPTP